MKYFIIAGEIFYFVLWSASSFPFSYVYKFKTHVQCR